ncbi:RNA polymerase sigma factor [Phenylobacterium sp.]|uniref:RNA polymerase sigma factor n=1 Tax=Phenylobacterium sp. TaxID=1871053 RepID=UPI002C4DA481|nr:RNA polymerase sigma factor [Phenylobacterium sp.]HVI30745.1 RNA polymerase sigma factor [Phenylobacterium sp.]
MKRPIRFVLTPDEGKSLADIRSQIVALLPRLRRLARVLTRDTADADDLVQLTVERALVRTDQWQPGTRLDSWMFRIMKNAWIDETRARTRRGAVFAPEEDGAQVGEDGAGAMEARLGARDVERAIARLPEEQRLAVALVLVEGLSYREAAEVLEVPQGTLTSRLFRGRAALMAELQESPR